MKLIKEIYEKDLQLEQIEKRDIHYKLRKAARALIFKENKIAVLNAVKLHLHKLPGGGIEKDESNVLGLHREILEETGCKIGEARELGIIIEYRDAIEMLQISYVFTGEVQGSAGVPNFTQKELGEGFQLVWLSVAEAIRIMKNDDSPNTYAGKFIHSRDLAILEYYSVCYEGKERYKKES
jgi:8-oxo-dGTP pyrophosphatase MutT (NUDIX family)